jgi:hypothetical protein
VSKKPPRCDCCDYRIRVNQHEVLLRDLRTSQEVGLYHYAEACVKAADKYLMPGVPMRLTVRHPPRCDPDRGYCADKLGTDPAIVLFEDKNSA